MNKKSIILIIIVVILIVAGFFLRGKITSFFKSDAGIVPPVSITPPTEEASTTPPVSPVTPGTPQSSQLKPKYPPYSGRDPKEVRPVPEEVKLFTEDQKKRIYAEIENYGDAVKKDQDFFNGWIQGGLLKKIIGDFEGARDMWEYAGIIRPQNSTSFANLGELYWRYLPNFPKSELNFKASIKNKPTEVASYISLSDLYFYSYSAQAALADDILLEGLAVNNNDINLMKALGALYERQKDYTKALEWWKKVLAKDPSNAEVSAKIKELEEKIK
ncbi:MAG: tetratricopeptide repeat protein [Candidatus Sungbacteria bacterium]|nr:tetratricopeptide repeat protein [Candidatus Sungbacteria bacterium]